MYLKYVFVSILLVFLIKSNAQVTQPPSFDYNKAWNEVSGFDQKGLPESALTVVNNIYAMANAEGNASQLVKAMIHILKYTSYKEEDAFKKNLTRLEQEAHKAVFPAKPLLHSMLAEVYWQYYEANRYRYGKRSETANFKNDDISTWSLEKIVAEVIRNYELSLQDTEKLKSTPIKSYNEVLSESNGMGLKYRPTLYDFLAHRAVDFFMNSEPELTQPAYAFSLNAAEYMAEADKFVNHNIATRDTFAYKYYALKILQDLIRFHQKDNVPDVLVDVDLKRLQFVYQNLTLPNKQELYLDALQKLEAKTISYPVSTRVTLQMANIWNEKGDEYKPLQSEDHKWDKKKAYNLCTVAMTRFPESEGGIQAYNFQKQILFKNISATVEKVNIPDLPFRALVSYKNFTALHWKIVQVTRDEVPAERIKWEKDYNVDREEKFIQHFAAKQAMKSGKVTLPVDSDFQQHSTEIKLDALPAGNYMILFSNSDKFETASNGVAYAFTSASNLAWINRNRDNGTTDFYVLNRTTGEPVAGARALLSFRVYNEKTGRNEMAKGDTFTTNAAGFINVPFQNFKKARNYYNAFEVEFTKGRDKVSTSDVDNYNQYEGQLYQSRTGDMAEEHTTFFLDRAIYRPGQTLHFKGLLTESRENTPKIIANRKLSIIFYDVNYQLVFQKQVVTNEYGTFSGTFTTPSSGLMGIMSLQASDNSGSQTFFSVEEYKRPKFEVKLDTVKGSYKLNELVHVTGQAKAYSGANIDGAQVQYRVIRQAIFPWWWWCRYGYYPSSPEMAITSGTGTTDADGRFYVNFKAIPDESVTKVSSPTFIYQVFADVTDINGETHSSSISVSAGYKALMLGVDLDDTDVNNEDSVKRPIAIRTTNLSGEFEPAAGTITIWKLKTPDKPFRERLWTRPDKFVMTKEEYYKSFPNDPYQEENNFYKWEKEKEVFSYHFDTSKEKKLAINNLKTWDPAKYLLEITSKDKYSEDVKEVDYFTITNSKDKNPSIPVFFESRGLKLSGEPGETARLIAGSSEKAQFLYEIEKDGKILDKQWKSFKSEQGIFEIPIKEEYRGNIAVHMVSIKNSRLYTSTQVITVLFTNKQLDIQFESFRDKLLPGQEEQWKIKISAKKADKAMAEMVATLYDASLDAFRMHEWYASFYNSMESRLGWTSTNGFEVDQFRIYMGTWNKYDPKSFDSPGYPNLNWFGYNATFFGVRENEMFEVVAMDRPSGKGRGAGAKLKKAAVMAEFDSHAKEEVLERTDSAPLPPPPPSIEPEAPKQDFSDVKIRQNFNETAFFYPDLKTNEQGEIVINFTVPEALTRWKMLGFAHTTDLKSGLVQKELVTQKDLMVVPNQPRFFRENDKMLFQAKISSMVDNDLSGQARLEFFDALTMKPVDSLLMNKNIVRNFSLKARQSANLEWSIEVPVGIQALTYRIVAKAGNFSDGEEMTLPVVTNRMLVTETLPLPIRGQQTKDFKLEKLANNTSSTLKNQRYTLEFTSNPAWYAIQALPYLMEYPYECTEQLFSRYYANSIASNIANSNPRIKQVFDTWANIQPDALLSNLEKNQELKTALLEETPWVLNAKSENQRKHNVALLFDLNKMGNEQAKALKKIVDAQLSNGGFPWFPGLPDDRYITQYIVTGMGHLDVMGVKSVKSDERTSQMLNSAIAYMDMKMHDEYTYLLAQSKKGLLKLEENHLDYLEIQYLYARSYFGNIALQDNHKEGYNYFISQAKKYWLKQNIYTQGMIALALKRFGEKQVPLDIVKSLSERALHSEEMGMYWKLERGYYWYQAPVETQALMIEVYDEVAGDNKSVEDLKVWLLKQKQTQDWKTTKATAEACYALLRHGTDVLASNKLAEVTIGGKLIDPATREDIKVEAGTGYFKTAWSASEITPDMGNIQVKKLDDGVAWGAVYWQYFEQLDKITPAETPLKISKKLFKRMNTERGPVISPVSDTTTLRTGDLIKVRIELSTDRTMEYIHLKDMRAAAFEPVETLSGYKYQDGLWYYQSPRDLSTNFFIGYLPKGNYVFEYSLRVSQVGDFSNGITTVQCMYAPEFSSHSEGVRVKVVRD